MLSQVLGGHVLNENFHAWRCWQGHWPMCVCFPTPSSVAKFEMEVDKLYVGICSVVL